MVASTGDFRGAKSKFLPALREATDRRSLEPRAVAVDVVGRAGEARAVAADDRHQRLVEAAVVGVGGGEAIARRRDAVAQPVEIDRQRPAGCRRRAGRRSSTLATAVPSSVWTSWLTGSLNGSQFGWSRSSMTMSAL